MSGIRSMGLVLAPIAFVVVACGSSSSPSSGSSGASPRTTPPVLHRASPPAACPSDRGSGQAPPKTAGSTCANDAECTTGTNGRCTAIGSGFAGTIFACTYDECANDAACGAGKVCDCRADALSAAPNACSLARCTRDADCGPGGWCSPSAAASGAENGIWYTGWACHTPDDECYEKSECAAAVPFTCAYNDTKKHWTCSIGASS